MQRCRAAAAASFSPVQTNQSHRTRLTTPSSALSLSALVRVGFLLLLWLWLWLRIWLSLSLKRSSVVPLRTLLPPSQRSQPRPRNESLDNHNPYKGGVMRFRTQVLVLVWAGYMGLGVGVVEGLPGRLAEQGRRAEVVIRQVSSVSAGEHLVSLAHLGHSHAPPITQLIHSSAPWPTANQYTFPTYDLDCTQRVTDPPEASSPSPSVSPAASAAPSTSGVS
jgi:hypothetical protein